MQDKDILFEELMSNYISGSITDKEKVSLFILVEESDLYRERYNEMVKLHALLHVPAFESQRETRYARLKERLHIMSGTTLRRRWFIYARNVAAVLLLMVSVSIGSIFTYNKLDESAEQLYNETTVPLGSQTKILLPDGSTAVLNSGSVLKYPLSYGKKERNVYLVGEGYFEVAKDAKKVFKVYAGGMQVKVTGTVFNIRSYPEDQATEVSLINGGVDVFANNKQVRLKPDEKAIYDRNTGDLYRETTDSYKSSLWTTGKLSFVNASFLDILKDIERKYNIKIHIESNKVANEYFTGSINLTMSLQEVFNFIDVDKKYRFEQSGSVVMLKDR
ncbi:FecR family protein [uncultured Parabacteroides sp.]|jgi:transmembrane sensor|uniref:FecR family protein n=1 Tax=uncultured Parabacteroides sp. TaxID=512312 RepID=UPI0025F5F318|nr:FecR family protein [uncultured Parabacteroides sp.]